MTGVPPTSEQAAVGARPQLLFFYSATSGRSRRVEGFMAQVLQRRRNHDTFELLRIAAEEHPDLLQRFKIVETPALVVVSERRVQARLVNPSGAAPIATLLEPWLK